MGNGAELNLTTAIYLVLLWVFLKGSAVVSIMTVQPIHWTVTLVVMFASAVRSEPWCQSLSCCHGYHKGWKLALAMFLTWGMKGLGALSAQHQIVAESLPGVGRISRQKPHCHKHQVLDKSLPLCASQHQMHQIIIIHVPSEQVQIRIMLPILFRWVNYSWIEENWVRNNCSSARQWWSVLCLSQSGKVMYSMLRTARRCLTLKTNQSFTPVIMSAEGITPVGKLLRIVGANSWQK